MAYKQLFPRFTPGSRVEQISNVSSHYRLSIPSGKADIYRLAQLDDYATLPRGRFPHRDSLSIGLSARTSSNSIPGTWGFGMWNDPFGMSLGFGGRPFRVPALPNAVWFFGASKENYLSFKSPRAERSALRLQASQKSLRTGKSLGRSVDEARAASTTNTSTAGLTSSIPSAQRGVANGFLAQSFRSPKFHPLLIPAGLALPFSRRITRRLMSQIIAEDGINLSRGNQLVAPTDWHRYRFEWCPKRVLFEVDDTQVFESIVSPNPPLGLVIWIDNQYAAFTPEGRISFGLLENAETAWLEVKDIFVES